jgi:mono/diheme cytochrome c family protein
MRVFVAALALLAFGHAACVRGPRSAAGFRLPPGDVEAGRAAFAELRCHSCHEVRGSAFPAAIVATPVKIGGVVPAYRTDGELATAIINPSHRLTGAYDVGTVSAAGRSPMGDFTEAMTVRQLVDLVAFVQSRYEVEPPMPAAQ